jgi:hypothetical protein
MTTYTASPDLHPLYGWNRGWNGDSSFCASIAKSAVYLFVRVWPSIVLGPI